MQNSPSTSEAARSIRARSRWVFDIYYLSCRGGTVRSLRYPGAFTLSPSDATQPFERGSISQRSGPGRRRSVTASPSRFDQEPSSASDPPVELAEDQVVDGHADDED